VDVDRAAQSFDTVGEAGQARTTRGIGSADSSSRTDSSRLPSRVASEISTREACACFIALASASDAT
jgi:hypothetical protein